ncbi:MULTISPECIES: alpha/beta fold hydrolase [Bradyrhizobium]|jgi:pimeloyl-ACP methyl ester carboxylesterase|uniref:Alpha/beta hydrolase n=1 Tax=Bradyrhizobium ottawaense TaxID=931866 RepID=A0A2U8P0A6_9BRAD|nr:MULTISPECIES: alpha/beta fold hydrolase [Bradyrhizobium]AWL91110.1 alpha/beta hydrolase [Bradyrhizobium ottawaense]MBR1329123.1 alpha/beta fold hydrolase [Bradyrhizobium ottawaense]MBR1335144.1 alpha/beta fold hydrolase [Bradyrhizobium ottawaense]MBR1364756.1 alpha/beta fold hydrolase [Bradyrhizobium ottawaense]
MREAPQSGDARCPGVVLLHGIARTSASLRKLERALQASGFATLNIDYPSRKKAIAALADDIHPAISGFAERDAPLHFVAHSMGGLVARAYIAKHRPARLGRVVMLGTPNSGSEVADLLSGSRLYRTFYGPAGLELTTAIRALPTVDYPVGVIAGNRFIDPVAGLLVLPKPNDGRVSVQSAMLAGMTDHVVAKASHTGLPRHAAAIEQTIAFLRDGRFRTAPLT